MSFGLHTPPSVGTTVALPSHCPWSGNPQQYDEKGRKIGPACPFMNKDQGLDFSCLVLGSKNVQPHYISIKGYPPGLSVLDFIELAEAGRVFSPIDLMDDYKWPMMVVRLKGEPAPFKLNENLKCDKGAELVIEPKEFAKLEIQFPGKKKVYTLYNMPKTFTVKDLKLALIIRYEIPMGESKALRTGLYQKSDEVFAHPFDNDMTLFQLNLQCNEKLIFNVKPEYFDDLKDKMTTTTGEKPKLPLTFWLILVFLIASVLFVVFSGMRKSKQ